MARTTLDFDRFLSEKRQEYLTVRAFGAEYRVKREIPALLPLTLARAEEAERPAALEMALLRAADVLLGCENVDALCEKGIGATELTALVEKILAEVCGVEGAETAVLEDDGRPPEGKKAGAKK